MKFVSLRGNVSVQLTSWHDHLLYIQHLQAFSILHVLYFTLQYLLIMIITFLLYAFAAMVMLSGGCQNPILITCILFVKSV